MHCIDVFLMTVGRVLITTTYLILVAFIATAKENNQLIDIPWNRVPGILQSST